MLDAVVSVLLHAALNRYPDIVCKEKLTLEQKKEFT